MTDPSDNLKQLDLILKVKVNKTSQEKHYLIQFKETLRPHDYEANIDQFCMHLYDSI